MLNNSISAYNATEKSANTTLTYGLIVLVLKANNLKSTYTADLQGKGTATFVDGLFNASFPKAFYFNYTCDYAFTISGLNVISGSAKASLLPSVLYLAQDYKNLDPKVSMEVTFDVDSIEVGGGFFAEAMTQALTGLFKNATANGMKDEFNKWFDMHMPLKTTERFEVSLSSTHTASVQKYHVAKSEYDNNTKHQIRFINAEITLNGQKIKKEISCSYTKSLDAGKSEVCYCKHLFMQIIAKDQFYEKVDLGTWGLKGKVAELQEMVPELALYYFPDQDFKVNAAAINAELDGTDVDKILLVKHFSFEIDQDKVFNVNVTFNLKLKGKYNEEKKKLDILYDSAEIEKINSSIKLTFIATIALGQYMLRDRGDERKESDIGRNKESFQCSGDSFACL
eukprot:TRINITY_DN12178_c0_g1_i6.p1 TRINITY_DN12178_c0_g1~~TRINITY_DN12178_c0_g1_i6.p1  ORF type:complete len:396 (+),score=95.72 TRINITY_DN12178_c0_g1_i6:122-1309(+)